MTTITAPTDTSNTQPVKQVRDPLSVTFSVWHALFLREALDRLFDMRAAWLWLLVEPILHIGFMAWVFSAIRVRAIGGVDIAVWIIVGMLAFFLFRRTAVQATYAAESNRPLFAYRQVKPFDTAIVRALLEAFLMAISSTIILFVAALLGHNVLPDNPLAVGSVLFGLWLFGVGYGLTAAVLIVLVPEMDHILKIFMMPLYLISGVIISPASIPQPYRDWILINPLAHGLELVRLGFASNYHTAAGVSEAYLYTWAISSLFLGLLLFRRFERRLIMQ